LTAIAFLTTRVNISTSNDDFKLKRTLKYLNGTIDITMKLNFNNQKISINDSIDASHGVHHDCRGHTGCIISIGNGSV
jgi:hypothetical protein